jgi:hypothetical protein
MGHNEATSRERDRVVSEDNIPLPHPDPWVDLTRQYVTQAVQALRSGGLKIERSWLDPRDPRDATVVYSIPGKTSSLALVWDEVSGWRQGQFVDGHQGIRTELSGAVHLGGGVLLSGPELTGRVLCGATEPRCAYRSAAALRDGLDDALGRG